MRRGWARQNYGGDLYQRPSIALGLFLEARCPCVGSILEDLLVHLQSGRDEIFTGGFDVCPKDLGWTVVDFVAV
jgi:hypothetical protein